MDLIPKNMCFIDDEQSHSQQYIPREKAINRTIIKIAMIILYWPIVIIVTLVLYGLIIISLPFSGTNATVFLFTLIAFWSRLPGVGLPTPLYILYLADLVDFFSLIIAINIGGPAGALFTIFTNLVSRACGVYPTWLAVSKDAIAQAVVCLIIPFVHVMLGGDIFVSMIAYTILRALMFLPLRLLPVQTSFPQFLVMMASMLPIQIAINGVYAKLFGDFLDGLMKSGVKFNWILFLGATVVILVAKISLFGISKSKNAWSIGAFKAIVRKTIGRKKEVEKKEHKAKREKQELDEVRELTKGLR